MKSMPLRSTVAAVTVVFTLAFVSSDAYATCYQQLGVNYASSLTFTIGTGAYGLRGGVDNVHAWLGFDNGGGIREVEVSSALGLNGGRPWLAWSIRSAVPQIALPGCPWPVDYIKTISLRTALAGGSWSLDSIGVVWHGIGHHKGSSDVTYGILLHIPSDSRSSIFRFTGADPYRVWSHAVVR